MTEKERPQSDVKGTGMSVGTGKLAVLKTDANNSVPKDALTGYAGTVVLSDRFFCLKTIPPSNAEIPKLWTHWTRPLKFPPSLYHSFLSKKSVIKLLNPITICPNE